MSEQRDPRVDPRPGDVVEIQIGERYSVAERMADDFVRFVYHSEYNTQLSGGMYWRFLTHWQETTRGASVVCIAQEAAHAD